MSGDRFELVTVKTSNQLHYNLEQLLKNKKHIDSLVVDKTTDEIRVDLNAMANGFGYPDFKLKILRGHATEVQNMMDRLKAQESPTRAQSDELFRHLDIKG